MSHDLEVDQNPAEFTPKNGENQSPENIPSTPRTSAHGSDHPLKDYSNGPEGIPVHESNPTQAAFDERDHTSEMPSDHSPNTNRRSTSPSLSVNNVYVAKEVSATSEGHSSPTTIEPHIESNQRSPATKFSSTLPREQQKYLMACMRNLKRHRDAAPFLQPVDPIKLGIPDYPKIVHRPMDLSTVERKLIRNEYASVDDYMKDVQLIFDNCLLYNGRESPYSLMANNLAKLFEKQMSRIPVGNTNVPRTPGPGTIGKKSKTPSSAHRNSVDIHRPKRDVHPPSTHDFTTPKNSAKKSSLTRKWDPRLKFCSAVIKELTKKAYHAFNAPFLQPVDPIALNIPDYPNIIRQPMDLGTIQRKLSGGQYLTADQFEADIRLMLRNCYTYNAVNTPVYNMGKQLEHIFQLKWREMPTVAELVPKATPVVQRVAPPPKSRQKSVARPKMAVVDELTDDSDVNQDIDLIQNQLQDMAAKLAALVAKKEKKKAVKKSSSGSTIKPASTPKTKASKASKATKTPRSVPAKPRTKKAPDATQRKRPRPEYLSAAAADDAEEITFEQKQEMSEKINCLPEDKVAVIAEMIRASMPHLTEENEIELDIEALDRQTLFKLYRFVNEYATPSLPTTVQDVKRHKTSEDLSRNDHYSSTTKPPETGFLSSSESSGSDSGTDSDSGSSSD